MTTHLTVEKIDTIVRVLDGWDGPLTWNLLIESAAIRLGECPTRQALSEHTRVLKAFQRRKQELKSGRTPLRTGRVEIEKLLERLSRTEAENRRLDSENEDLLDQFRRWAYNAHISGITLEMLNAPLPKVDRRNPK
ncbi:MAG TPA: hypothetical protein VF169_11220 [Albitalea sp.]|uniref:hypothetical protein n=1 Tax=Piscinibacter sp. TaxID=1903157 RepID=UPI002ED323DE